MTEGDDGLPCDVEPKSADILEFKAPAPPPPMTPEKIKRLLREQHQRILSAEEEKKFQEKMDQDIDDLRKKILAAGEEPVV